MEIFHEVFDASSAKYSRLLTTEDK